MLQDNHMSETEVRKILCLKIAGESKQEILRLIKRPKTAIHNILIRKKIK